MKEAIPVCGRVARNASSQNQGRVQGNRALPGPVQNEAGSGKFENRMRETQIPV